MHSTKLLVVRCNWELLKMLQNLITLLFTFWIRVFFCLFACLFFVSVFGWHTTFVELLSGYTSGQGTEEVLGLWLNLISQLIVYYIIAKIKCLYSQCCSDSFAGDILFYQISLVADISATYTESYISLYLDTISSNWFFLY